MKQPTIIAISLLSLLSLWPGAAREAVAMAGKPSTPEVTEPEPTCDGGFFLGQRCVKWEHLTQIPREPQPTDPGNYVYDFDKSYDNMGALKTDEQMIEPDAELGKWYMYNGNYVRLGVSYPSYVATNVPVRPEEQLAIREERNRELPYNLNAVKARDGADIAAPNCTVCHSSVFQDQLVEGLGRNNHFIGTDASGFTLNVLGIGVNSLIRGDTGLQLKHGLTLLLRLFRDASTHSHLFDLFAGLGMRHDPDTLEWNGRLWGNPNSGMRGWIDFPAWWHLKKKNALYANGSGRGAKADHLLYMSWFSVDGIPEAEEIQNNFAHVQKWIEQEINAPKYEDFGGVIDYDLAAEGEPVYLRNCAVCHGTYSEDESVETYPNMLVDLAEVGTDPYLATNNWIYPVKTWYDVSWYGTRGTSHIVETNGYVAPPLDGVFITAPYFHNGSVPTLEAVLDSSKRPTVWTSNQSDDDYDWDAMGWKDKPGDWRFILALRSKFGIGVGRGRYDTRRPGNSNQGHTYGDQLTDDERQALLEYLKTL